MLMRQKVITRVDLRANPYALYAFGDNARRVGNGGQAFVMRGEPNAVGVRTKWEPSMRPGAFFRDDQEIEVRAMWVEDLAPLHRHHVQGGIVVLPLDGLGTGLARLAQRAPKLAEILDFELAYIWGRSLPRP